MYTCLPPITTEGKNTFGCKINGKNWVSKSNRSTIGIRVDLWQNTVNIIAENAQTLDGLTINLNPVIDTGNIALPTNEFDDAIGRYFQNYSLKFISDPLNTGFIHFSRVDYQKGLFCGTFAFDLYNDKGDTMHITEGRFDVKK
jgi:hypothetical protein